MSTTLDPTAAEELWRRAATLQTEASEVIQTLAPLTRFDRVGITEHVGSSVSGLMVWRDIDISVRCRNLTRERAWDALRPLLIQASTKRLDYRDQTGARCPYELRGDQRYSFVVFHETPAGDGWRIDISLWLSVAPRNQLAQLDELTRRLTDETQLAIRWIKDVWRHLPTYPELVGGTAVYDAVLEHGARMPEACARYLRQRGLPGR